jgi:hypothetical protein
MGTHLHLLPPAIAGAPMIFIHPKVSSTRLRIYRLTA